MGFLNSLATARPVAIPYLERRKHIGIESRMRSYILSREHFSDRFVAEIKAAIPAGWHCIETRHPVNAAVQPPNVLCILSGSPTQQKERSVKIRYGGGAAGGAFNLPVQKLEEFFGELSSRAAKEEE